jgi:hypothetical protein
VSQVDSDYRDAVAQRARQEHRKRISPLTVLLVVGTAFLVGVTLGMIV